MFINSGSSSQLQCCTNRKVFLFSYSTLQHGNFGVGVKLCVRGALLATGTWGQSFLSLSHADFQ